MKQIKKIMIEKKRYEVKKLLFLIIMAAIGVSATAKPIRKSSAAAKAEKYMFGMSSQSKGMRTQGTGRIRSVLTTDADDVAYYAFNAADGKGFVIISGDDELPELVGYSKCGSLSADDMSDGLKYYLECYTEYVRQMREGLLPARKTEVDNSYTPVVDTLITTLWNQTYPYNKYAPEEKNYFPKEYNSRFPIGCVALAYAQVMNYWQWPKAINPEVDSLKAIYSILDKEGKVLGKKIPSVIYPNADGNKPYDWERIGEKKMTYNNAEGVDDYEAKADAVGLLLRDVAYALDMSWDNTGGGTLSQTGILTHYFGYSKETSILLTNCFEGGNKSQEWLDLIKTDLDKHQPIIYGGSGTAGGHCFVFDGYDTGNRVHVNWGWGGDDNGWYDVYYLNTSVYDNRGKGTYDFSKNNYMIHNLHPNYDGKEEHMKPTRHSLAHNGTTIIHYIGEDEASAYIDQAPFVALYNSSLSFCPTTYIDCWMSGIDYDVRLTRVSQETGETDTYTVLDALKSQESFPLQNYSVFRGLMIPADTVRTLPDGIYAYTVEYNISNDAQEQTGWLTPYLFQATPSNTFYLEKKDDQCVFYVSPDIYNVIDYKLIDEDDARGWYNINSNKDIDSIQLGDGVTFGCTIDLPEVKNIPTDSDYDDSYEPFIAVIDQDNIVRGYSPIQLKVKKLDDEALKQDTIYSISASTQMEAVFSTPGTYTLSIDIPKLGYRFQKSIVIGDTETGITNVTIPDIPRTVATYSLSGQRVGDGYKGIVIKNGKKYIFR